MKNFLAIGFCIIIYCPQTLCSKINYGVKVSYLVNYDIRQADFYDAFPISAFIKKNKFKLYGGPMICRAIPDKKFEGTVGYHFGFQYTIYNHSNFHTNVYYAHHKFVQHYEMGVDDNYVNVYFYLNSIGFEGDIRTFKNIYTSINIAYGLSKYDFDEPYPGWGKSNNLTFELGIYFQI